MKLWPDNIDEGWRFSQRLLLYAVALNLCGIPIDVIDIWVDRRLFDVLILAFRISMVFYLLWSYQLTRKRQRFYDRFHETCRRADNAIATHNYTAAECELEQLEAWSRDAQKK